MIVQFAFGGIVNTDKQVTFIKPAGTCEAYECALKLYDRKFVMCRWHWGKVPLMLKDKLYAAHKKGLGRNYFEVLQECREAIK